MLFDEPEDTEKYYIDKCKEMLSDAEEQYTWAERYQQPINIQSVDFKQITKDALKAVEEKRRAEEFKHQKMAKEAEAIKRAESCFEPEIFKPFATRLFSKLSEDDCKALIQFVSAELSKDDRTLKLSPSLETAILKFMIENQ